jgi:hypothetical protein
MEVGKLEAQLQQMQTENVELRWALLAASAATCAARHYRDSFNAVSRLLDQDC